MNKVCQHQSDHHLKQFGFYVGSDLLVKKNHAKLGQQVITDFKPYYMVHIFESRS